VNDNIQFEKSSDPLDPSERSLLDRVISSQQSASIEQFHPQELVTALFRGLSEKEEDVLRRRFGLLGPDPETLEDIGARYAVTRERIRQIQSAAIAKIKRAKSFAGTRAAFEHLTVGVLTSRGGVMEQEELFGELLTFAGDTPTHRPSLRFLLTEMLSDRVVFEPASRDLEAAWRLIHGNLDRVRAVARDADRFFETRGKPASREELLAAAKDFPSVTAGGAPLMPEAVLSALTLAKSISANPFGDWGLSKWGSIVPRRINDKIALVLEKAAEPLHFTEIAKRINDARFDSRTAYAPTVHNELILNDRYVLVGRGLYALKSWGYRAGVVADVLEDILRSSGEPLTRAELVRRVLEQRFVKKNTVHLALTDRNRFVRNANGTYALTKSGGEEGKPSVPA
jgi:hypothetical protein